MSELVFSDTIERNRNQVDGMDGGRILLDEKFSIFRRPGKVCFVASTLVCGVPKERIDGYVKHNTAKRYYYWRSTDSYGFRRNKAGFIQPYECSRSWDAPVGTHWRHRQPRAPWQLFDKHESDMGFKAAQEFRHAVWSEFGIESPQDVYPLMNTYGLIHPWTIPNSLKPAFRSDDVTALARYAFGRKRTTPELVKAVAGTEPYMVAYAQQFRGLVPDSSLVAFMRDNHFDDEMEEIFQPHTPDFRKGLLNNTGLAQPLIDLRLDAEDLKRIQRVMMFGKGAMNTHFTIGARRAVKNWKELL